MVTVAFGGGQHSFVETGSPWNGRLANASRAPGNEQTLAYRTGHGDAERPNLPRSAALREVEDQSWAAGESLISEEMPCAMS